ncbi:MAG TPA: ATPase, T2SS/T4P/T4SS family, partial [Methylomirabilota bacterium]|nr:ATPase, T2SS/T4P/T4SS family [Methylomirabilota bacterium]
MTLGSRFPAHDAAAPAADATAPGERIGDLLVREGLVTRAQLDAALEVQRQLRTYVPLGHLLVSQKALTRPQLTRFLDRHRKRLPLGRILLKTGAISLEQLEAALEEHRRTGRHLGETLLALKYASEETVRRALCTQLHIHFFDLDGIVLDRRLAALINEKYAAKHMVIPLARVGGTLVVAMDDPTKVWLVQDLQATIGLGVEVVTSTTASLRRAYARLYEGTAPFSPEVTEDVVLTDPNARALYERLTADEPPPAVDRARPVEAALPQSADRVVRQLLYTAIDLRASDIHLEAVDQRVVVRFRIDGVLQNPELGLLEDAVTQNRAEVVSRIKILSRLDIAERRRPQDGSFRARLEKDGVCVNLDFRVSIIPGYYGENVVLRMLDPRTAPESVDTLGFSPLISQRLRQLLATPAGIILVTGPTGSGKSTTLFGALRTLHRPEIKILTAENPIEYVCDRFSQHEVNERVGNTFASYLRAFLRHDPEVIMLGEIRDGETAELAFRAAQTGHLVLSTLHTNDAVSAVTRLWDLGVDSSTIASSLLGVLSQRLVRQICPACREESLASDELVRGIFLVPPTGMRWYRGRGCRGCHFTGYKGRIAVA